MEESYRKGLATHTDTESCGVTCKGDVEALTGGCAGRVFSRERNLLRDADALGGNGRHHPERRYREGLWGPRAVTDPVPVPKHLAWEPGDPAFTPNGRCLGTDREVQGHRPRMNEHGKSDRPVVPAKPLPSVPSAAGCPALFGDYSDCLQVRNFGPGICLIMARRGPSACDRHHSVG
jgi:hypothetical protein